MSHHNIHLTHEFLRKKEVNHIYISIFIMTLAEGLIGIFAPIYLFQLGYSIVNIIFFYFLHSAYFLLFSFIGANVVSRCGAKHSILISTPFLVLYYLGLTRIPDANYLFFILPAMVSLRMVLYNYGFHLNYIQHSDRKTRGNELSFIGILTTVSTVLSPMVAGFTILFFDFNTLFMLASLLLVAGVMPLLMTRDEYPSGTIGARELLRYTFRKRNSMRILSFSGYAIESIIGRVLWPIFLILVLANVETVGTVVTLTLMLSIAVFYLIGRMTDRYDRNIILSISTLFYVLGWIARIFAVSPISIFFIESCRNIAEKVLHIPWSAKMYDMPSRREHFKFIVSREMVFNAVRIIILPLIMLVFYVDFNPFILSFIIAAIASLLYPFL